MCGIYGYIGKRNAYQVVIDGLKQLQYRGYDSCGIAYYNDEFKINKAIGTLENLNNDINNVKIAFGHTRWATNGGVNTYNTHPHVSMHGEYTIVHNGIITNADKLKEYLINKGYSFYSETDTEVIANLLESIEGTSIDRINKLFDILEGSFSLIIGDKCGRIYAVKEFSPLNILKSNDGIHISSDINSLPDGMLYSLNDRDVLMIEDNHIVSNKELSFVKYKSKLKTLDLNGHKSYMIKEIHETPNAIKNTYHYLRNKNVRQIFKHYNKITMLGCGTAYNSCLIGEQLFNNYTKLKANTSLASNYKVGKFDRHLLHIIVSQSGETADCIKVAKEIKEKKGKLLVITNEENSSITKYADYLILTMAEKEVAVASTKTYSCQVFTFAYIVNVLINKNYDLDITEFSNKLANFIENIDITDYVKRIADCKHLILIGKGIDYCTMVEASLKIREIGYMYTIPMYASELKHGTLSLIEKNTIVLALNTDRGSDLNTTKNEIESRQGILLDFDKYIPTLDIDKKYLPIFSIIPFQLLSYEIAIARGYNPDMPRNLAKSVTVE